MLDRPRDMPHDREQREREVRINAEFDRAAQVVDAGWPPPSPLSPTSYPFHPLRLCTATDSEPVSLYLTLASELPPITAAQHALLWHATHAVLPPVDVTCLLTSTASALATARPAPTPLPHHISPDLEVAPRCDSAHLSTSPFMGYAPASTCSTAGWGGALMHETSLGDAGCDGAAGDSRSGGDGGGGGGGGDAGGDNGDDWDGVDEQGPLPPGWSWSYCPRTGARMWLNMHVLHHHLQWRFEHDPFYPDRSVSLAQLTFPPVWPPAGLQRQRARHGLPEYTRASHSDTDDDDLDDADGLYDADDLCDALDDLGSF